MDIIISFQISPGNIYLVAFVAAPGTLSCGWLQPSSVAQPIEQAVALAELEVGSSDVGPMEKALAPQQIR